MIQNFCGYSGLINFLTCFTLALFLFFKNRSGKINQLFALWSASVAFWSLGYFLWLFTPNANQALLLTRVLMAGAIIIPSSYLHFALVYLNVEGSHKKLIREKKWGQRKWGQGFTFDEMTADDNIPALWLVH